MQRNQRPAPAGIGPNGIGPRFESAPQPDMVRALQKDDFFLNLFKDDCRELFSNILGNRMSQWEHAIDLFSNACYYGFTTLTGSKSLGEEYCDLAMVCTDLESRPSPARRGFLFFLEVCVPYVYNKLKSMARPYRPTGLFGRIWAYCLDLVVSSSSYFPVVSKLHLALFYLFGRYLQLSKRIAGIRYVFLRKLDAPRPGYALLGVLICIHFFVLGLMLLRRRLFTQPSVDSLQSEAKESDEDLQDSGPDADEATNCTLCLCPREDTTATECGHLYCWDCISNACSTKAECPMCRSPCEPSKLLRLSHYL